MARRPTTGPERTERIVVGIDGSDTSRRALQWAAEEAALRGAALSVVHAWEPPYAGDFPYSPAAFDPASHEDQARLVLERAVQQLDHSRFAVPVERVLLAGGAAQAILDLAKGADLVVVGSRGRGGVRGLLLGSVSQQVVHHATCPVVIIPPER